MLKEFATKIIVAGMILLSATSAVSAQVLKPQLELRTSEELILDPGQQVVLTLIVVNSHEKNSISLKLNTLGGVRIKDISLLNTYIYLNKQISPSGASVDLAKTDLFTNEDIVGTVTVEMTGLEDGSIIISRESLIDNVAVGEDFKVDIRYSGVTPITSHPPESSLIGVITKTIDDIGITLARQFGVSKDLILVVIGIAVLVLLVGLFTLLRSRDQKPKTKVEPVKPISTSDLNIGGSPSLTPIPPAPVAEVAGDLSSSAPSQPAQPAPESPAPLQTVALPN